MSEHFPLKSSKALTIADARKFAKSDKFHMPVSYQKAVAELKRCKTLDGAKYFDNAAEALAVWASIYRNNEAGRQAKQLRLHAHRRMGQLARELAPGKPKKGGGRYPGPSAKLQEYGLSHHQANAATHLAKLGKRDFNKLVKQKSPPAPTSVTRRYRQPGTTTQWELLRQSQRNPFACYGFVQKNDPIEIAKALNKGEVDFARTITIALIEWLDRFEQALPKKKGNVG